MMLSEEIWLTEDDFVIVIENRPDQGILTFSLQEMEIVPEESDENRTTIKCKKAAYADLSEENVEMLIYTLQGILDKNKKHDSIDY